MKKDIPGDKLVFGNDFDHPIRDRLPWGFNTAFNWVKGWVDATMEGDVYADEPYLYSPILSSMNILQIGGKGQSISEVGEGAGEKVGTGDESALIFKEGAQADGQEVREKSGMPSDNSQRKRHYQQLQPRKDFIFEKDRAFACDFFNGYLDFNGALQYIRKICYVADQALRVLAEASDHHHPRDQVLGRPAPSVCARTSPAHLCEIRLLFITIFSRKHVA